MKFEPITFPDLEKKLVIDLRGTIEARMDKNTIIRGRIEQITWWQGYHPRIIHWSETLIWQPGAARWSRGRSGYNGCQFPFRIHDNFIGPYEMENREIFFLIEYTNQYYVIFPSTIFAPERPYDYKSCRNIHAEFMNPVNSHTK